MNSKVGYEILQNKKIFYVLEEPDEVTNKIVIMSHGFRGTSIGPARTFVDFGRMLVNNGFAVLRFDQPNSGNSEGNYIDSSFNQWVVTTEYFSKRYLDINYQVVLLGQSMGATTTMLATTKSSLKNKIPAIILWVPDPKSTFSENPNEVFEEGGQKYKGTFWQEAKDANFFSALEKYSGKIHLVYGEDDKYIAKELRSEVMEKVTKKGGELIVLPGQDHSSWDFIVAQEVYKKELEWLKKVL